MKAAAVAALCAALLFPPPASAEEADAGARAFQKCISCHGLDRAETDLSGPTLAGIVGRRAAAVAGFGYSPAMRRAGAEGLVWTADALHRYLTDPLGIMPDTTMSFAGVRDAGERRALIEYLRRFE